MPLTENTATAGQVAKLSPPPLLPTITSPQQSGKGERLAHINPNSVEVKEALDRLSAVVWRALERLEAGAA